LWRAGQPDSLLFRLGGLVLPASHGRFTSVPFTI
jgi:hypothetical protein